MESHQGKPNSVAGLGMASKPMASSRIGIVASSFNNFITKRLLHACLTELRHNGFKETQVTTVWVPGSLEIPLTALKLARRKNIAAVIALGAVIRGQTYHFQVVANECVRGLMDVGLQTGKPIIMGVLTTDTGSQALARSGSKDNKGRDCAKAALAMIALLKKL